MDAEGNITTYINRYTYRGKEGEVIPDDATHIFVVAKVVRAWTFYEHPNIVEVICHEDVEKIEQYAFYHCPRLKRVIMPGVKIVGGFAFDNCGALTDVECDKLEIIKVYAFSSCTSLRSINMPSARIAEKGAFSDCKTLTNAKFGSKLERIERGAFYACTSLERITIPLKDGIITHTFKACKKLKHVDLVEVGLHETIAALHLEEWRSDLYKEISSISQILPTAPAGDRRNDAGEMAVAIRAWIRSLLGNIVHYKEEHRRLLDEDVAPTLQSFLPQDIVINSVLPFLNLPPYTFEVADRA